MGLSSLACIPARTALLAGLLIALAGVVLGWNLGEDHLRAQQADDLQAVIDAGDAQADRTSQTNAAGRAQGAKAAIENEDHGHAVQAEVRTIYRNVAVADDCREPADVVRLGEAEVERANDRVRAAAGASAAAVPDRGGLPRERR